MSNSEIEEVEANEYSKQRINEAVNTLDFDEADRLNQSIKKVKNDNTMNSKSEIQAMHEQEIQNIHLETEQRINEIDREAALKSSDCVARYHKMFEEIKVKQDDEVNKLSEEWERTHQEVADAAQEKVDSILYTSKVMASCNYIKDAKKVRDDAEHNKKSFISKETGRIDKFYKKQFDLMLKKHKVILDGLYQQMNNELESIKSDANVEKTAAQSREQINLAKTSMLSMTNIALSNNLSASEKSSLITEFSPRSKQRSRNTSMLK